VANPTALLLAAVMMLHHLEEHAAALRVMSGLEQVLASEQSRTRDLGGTATTAVFTDALVRAIES